MRTTKQKRAGALARFLGLAGVALLLLSQAGPAGAADEPTAAAGGKRLVPVAGLPHPALVWAQTPREVRVAFDRPLRPEDLAGLGGRASIAYGRHVAAGDQLRAPRFTLAVRGAQVTPDLRTLILYTDPHPEAVGYALTLRGPGRPAKGDGERGGLPQAPETDLGYDLCGVEAAWRARAEGGGGSAWLPHLDLSVARKLTAPSADHREFGRLCRGPGALTLRTVLDLKDMLRPAVSPGSRLDHAPPPERVTVTFRSPAGFTVKAGGGPRAATRGRDGAFTAALTVAGAARVPVEVVLPTGGGAPELTVAWHTAEDVRPRALPLRRLLLPWAAAERAAAAADVPELKGGNWARGRKAFFSDEAGCARCHTVRGEGGAVGPDLSNLPHRDYHSVLRDIADPSYAFNTDYVTQVITLRDGRVLTGAVRPEGDRLLVGDGQGAVTAVRRAEVKSIIPSPVSLMPGELPKVLGPEGMRDLLTFLLTHPPRMPDYGRARPPAPRSRKEVAAALAGAPPAADPPRPLTVVLVAGPKGHGPGAHDYPAWQKAWARLLRMAEATEVGTADGWPSAGQLRTADVLVFYQRGRWTPARARDLDAFLARGGGAVFVHDAVDGGADAPGLARRIGLAWQGGMSRSRHGPVELEFDGARHPIARNLGSLRLHDESYWRLVGDPRRVTRLAAGKEEGRDQPLFWTVEAAKGRVVVSIPGHFAWTFDDPLFRLLLLRGIAWAARAPVDRFNDLVTPGARVRD
jgi:putative heme-binding domain-containing protein